MLEEEAAQKWHPTHVQVTVLQAQHLHPKGKHGTNDAYTIIQLGKEKYSTSVVEKSFAPVWKEEACFELPGPLQERAPDQQQLHLAVMHRSLVGLDKFLGQVTININTTYDNGERHKTEWYKLEAKPGKRRKERGKLQVSVQFMRSNMTASMFDLSMKDKTRSPFTRLKDKMKGRKPDGSDTSSAILPSRRQLHAPPLPGPQARSKANKPFLLGPQRLSSAHSMSDLMPSCGGIPGKHTLDAISSAEESGGLKSPHRRTMSADTSQEGECEGDWGGSAALSASVPHKFATLPRQWAPGDDHAPCRSGEGRKRDKVSLLERVTGKKDAKRSDFSDSTNPFRAGGHAAEVRSQHRLVAEVSAQRGRKRGEEVYPTLQGLMEQKGPPGPGLYGHLSRREVEQELQKHKELLKKKDGHIRELEDYIDNLLVRVMEETPSILRVPYVPSRKAGRHLRHEGEGRTDSVTSVHRAHARRL